MVDEPTIRGVNAFHSSRPAGQVAFSQLSIHGSNILSDDESVLVAACIVLLRAASHFSLCAGTFFRATRLTYLLIALAICPCETSVSFGIGAWRGWVGSCPCLMSIVFGG